MPTSPSTGSFRLADQPADFKRFGVDPARIVPAEDGRRSSDGAGQFEWWYADALLNPGGIGIAVVFFTKPFMQPAGPLAPVVMISLKRPGEDPQPKSTPPFDPKQFSASSAQCDVCVGANRFQGDLNHYVIEASIDGLSVKLELDSLAQPLRLGTGHQLFESQGVERYFAWLPSVPLASAKATITENGTTTKFTGFGYHDHNWGDTDMPGLMHHWYWARAQIGTYTVIAAHITAQAMFGSGEIPVFLLLNNGKQIDLTGASIRFEKSLESPDPDSGKLVADVTRYRVELGATVYLVSFFRQETIHRDRFDPPGTPPNPQVGGAYLRFKGLCTLQIVQAGQVTDLPPARAMWEFMFFGDQPAAAMLGQAVRSMSLARSF